ncbi:MAG: response regulator transcription factor [Planctomycetes bacterium]|nr:response regulator transcription factor [Planctomycetota bacterium]
MRHVTVLAVDPDRVNLSALRLSFYRRGWDVDLALTADQALAKSRSRGPRLAIINLSLGSDEALRLIRAWREDFATSRIPILLLAVSGQERRVVEALDRGAHDVVILPAEERPLRARVGRMIAWRTAPGAQRYLSSGPVTLDVDRSALVRPRPASPLTPCEIQILRWLLTPPGRAYSRRQLVAALRPAYPSRGVERAVDVHVASLRRKLGRVGACIETLRGVGYRFEAASS